MNEFSNHHSKLANEDLISIAYFEKRTIKKKARDSAKQILIERRVPANEIDVIKGDIRGRKKEERLAKLRSKEVRNMEFPYRCIAWRLRMPADNMRR